LCRINLKVDQCLLRRRLTAIFGVTVDHSSEESLRFALISCNKEEVVYDAEEDLGVDCEPYQTPIGPTRTFAAPTESGARVKYNRSSSI
jgi:hypothetical protein